MGSNCSCMNEISLGPWGYHTAEEWSFKPKGGAGIKQIIVRYGGIIHSIVFQTDAGDYSTKFGGEGGDKTVKIDVDYPSEYLTGISGTHGYGYWSYGYVVCSLTFHTNKSKYGPFGSSGSGTGFCVNANDGVITGFHGRCGQFLKAIGVYVMPVCCSHTTEMRRIELLNSDHCASNSSLNHLSLTRGPGPIGGGGGRDWDDGVFSAVTGIHVRVRVDTGVVAAVRFSYLKRDGSDFLSPFYGSCFGNVLGKTVAFDKDDEYLIGVEGFYGVVAQGPTVITSLTFVTNKAKYGPAGDEIGTFFTFMNTGDCNRRVVGFHGRSGAYLDAIGIHAEYL